MTGMRVGEAVALQSGDVDLDDGVITISEQVAKLERGFCPIFCVRSW